MEKIDFLSSSNSGDSKLLLACANGVPYAIRLCTNCCSTTATSYINLATGVSSSTPPSGLSIGECADVVCPPVYETESFVATAGQTSFSLSHAPYKDVDFTRNGATLVDSVATVNGNTVTYVPSENNNITLLAGDDITISYLYLDPSCTEFSINSVICFEFTEGPTISNIKVVSLNNSVTYYEDGLKITDSARITEVEQLVLNANSDNVVDCNTSPDSQICYEFTEGGDGGTCPTVTADVSGFQVGFRLDLTAGAVLELAATELETDPFGVFTPITPPIRISDSAPTLAASLESLAAEFKAKVLSRYQVQQPWLDSVVAFEETDSQGRISLNFFMYGSCEPNKSYSGLCGDPACEPYLKITTNGVMGGGNIGDPKVRTGIQIPDPACTCSGGGGGGTGTTISIKAITVNGVTTYYEDGVAVTDSTRISEIKAFIEGATADNVVCCPDCGGGTVADGSETKVQAGTGTTVTGTGTTSDPYIVNATTIPADGSETKIQAGTGIDITGSGTTADPYIISEEPDPAFGNIVYVNSTSPSSATIFSLDNPPVTNDDSLKQNDSNLYIGTDGTTWVWNTSTSTYTTYAYPSSTKKILKTTRNTTTSIAAPGNFLTSWPTSTIDTTSGAWNASTGTYTVNKTGYYRISASVQFDNANTWAAGDRPYWQIRKNGTTTLASNLVVQAAYTGGLTVPYAEGIEYLTVGTQLQLFTGHNSATAKVVSSNSSINQFIVEEI